jgi:hypothetical protein
MIKNVVMDCRIPKIVVLSIQKNLAAENSGKLSFIIPLNIFTSSFLPPFAQYRYLLSNLTIVSPSSRMASHDTIITTLPTYNLQNKSRQNREVKSYKEYD